MKGVYMTRSIQKTFCHFWDGNFRNKSYGFFYSVWVQSSEKQILEDNYTAIRDSIYGLCDFNFYQVPRFDDHSIKLFWFFSSVRNNNGSVYQHYG